MKRLLRDLSVLMLVSLLAFGLDRLGVYAALAGRLLPTVRALADAAETWEAESAPYVPPAAPEMPEVTPAPTPEVLPAPSPVLSFSSPRVRNSGTLPVDARALLREGWDHTLPPEGPQILIYHTHSCEAYTPSGGDDYEPSGDYRTLEASQSVIAVGDALAEKLEAAGFTVLHCREVFDYPEYNGAYDRSGARVLALLEENPTLRVVIDLHRDSLGGKRTEYVTPDGADSAQVMLLLTTGENGLYHPNWRENLKLGLEVQSELEGSYDGLTRPLSLSPARYNQQLSPGAFLVEVGTEANTLREAKKAAELFGDCLAQALLRHVDD